MSNVTQRIQTTAIHKQTERAPYQPDVLLLTSSLLILAVGILFVYSASSIQAERLYGATYFYLLKQAVFAVVGVGVMFGIARIDYHRWLRLTPVFYAMALFGLVLVLTGIGHEAGGSSRWIRLGGVSIQPSEFAKLALIFYLAHTLANRRQQIRDFKHGFLPTVIVCGILMLLTLRQPDFGTTITMGVIMVVLLFVAGTRPIFLIGSALAAAPVIYWALFSADYRKRRLLAYLDPWSDAAGSGFQIIQSYIAFGSGGLSGRGLGDGRQKLFFLPEAHTDFIFAVFGEEAGFVGVVFLILLFALVVWRGMMIAAEASDEYGAFLAAGLTCLFGIQSFVNMAVVTGLVPTKGLALPLMSYGGSALLMNLIAIGLLQSVHIHRRRPV